MLTEGIRPHAPRARAHRERRPRRVAPHEHERDRPPHEGRRHVRLWPPRRRARVPVVRLASHLPSPLEERRGEESSRADERGGARGRSSIGELVQDGVNGRTFRTAEDLADRLIVRPPSLRLLPSLPRSLASPHLARPDPSPSPLPPPPAHPRPARPRPSSKPTRSRSPPTSTSSARASPRRRTVAAAAVAAVRSARVRVWEREREREEERARRRGGAAGRTVGTGSSGRCSRRDSETLFLDWALRPCSSMRGGNPAACVQLLLRVPSSFVLLLRPHGRPSPLAPPSLRPPARPHPPTHPPQELLQRPNLDHRVPAATRRVPVHEPEPLDRGVVPVGAQARVLHRRAVVDTDVVAAGGAEDLARVELERRHGVVVAERVRDGARAEVPDLVESRGREVSVCGQEAGRKGGREGEERRTRIVRSREPLTRWYSSNWRHVTGPV